MKVFIDTNIVISAILFPKGKVATVLSHILNRHTVVVSSYTKDECFEVFRKKFPTKTSLLEDFFEVIGFEIFNCPTKYDASQYPEIRDTKDLPILVSAILSDSDILLTGDKDFDDLKIEKPLIISPTQYYEFIKNS
ncbi:MAG: putative toxin-antitoxin system toxin component, PIN family [Salinivirgaceae bacterium]|nr:putative toxin-antitoxin system toxin component, PIN family [Salinivirgaceae bacterium]